MRFPEMRATQSYQKTIPALNGGMNTQMPPEYIADTQLADCRNVYWANGALRTRPAFFGYTHDELCEAILATHETPDGEYACICTVFRVLVYKGFYSSPVFDYSLNCFDQYGDHNAFFADDGKGNVLLFWQETERSGEFHCNIFTILPDGDNTKIQTADPYIPKVLVNGQGVETAALKAIEETTDSESTEESADENGNRASSNKTYEGFNMLTTKCRTLWTTDGVGIRFRPPFQMNAGNYTIKYTHTDGALYSFSFYVSDEFPFDTWKPSDGVYPQIQIDKTNSKGEVESSETIAIQPRISLSGNYIAFANENTSELIPLPFVGFSNNLEILVNRYCAVDEWRAKLKEIHSMRLSTWFGGDRSGVAGGTRLFLCGNADAPNLVRYSDVNEPLYFPENSCLYVGDKSQAVTAFGKQSGALILFKEREMYYAEYAFSEVSDEDIIDGTQVDVTSSTFFPLTQLHPAIGCDLPDTVKLCGNRLVWACRSGEVFTLTSLSNWTDKSVRCLSYVIEPTIKRTLDDGHAVLYNGNYLLFSGRRVYLFDYMSNGFTYFSSFADDKKGGVTIPWFYWEIPDGYGEVTHVFGRDTDTTLFLTREDGNEAAVIPAHFDERWKTDHLGLNSDCDDIEIISSVTTKQFHFDRPHNLKMLCGLFLHLGQTGSAVQTTYLLDDGREEEAVYTAVTKEGTATTFAPVRMPCRQARVRTAGLRLESRDRLLLSGITWEFRTIGEVK